MLESVTLKNFQSHKLLTVEFDPAVTCLTGPTDSGKSAVLRALRWALTNKLSGTPDSYISWGKEMCSVRVRLDGRTLTRKKGRGMNLYKLDGEPFKAFGAGVPAPIVSFVNVGPNNFQRQLDPQFWITESAGQIAKNLNQIVNLEVIDKSIANVAAKVRKAKAEHEVVRVRLTEFRRQRKELAWVKDANRDLKHLETSDIRLKALTSKIAYTASLVQGVSDYTLTLDRASGATLGGLKAVRAGRQWAKIAARVGNLSALIQNVEHARRSVREIPDIKPLKKLRGRADEVSENRRRLESLIEAVTSHEELLCRAKTGLITAQKELQQSTPRVCPTCHQPIPKSSLFSVQTSTLASSHQCSDPKKKTGLQRRPVTSRRSEN